MSDPSKQQTMREQLCTLEVDYRRQSNNDMATRIASCGRRHAFLMVWAPPSRCGTWTFRLKNKKYNMKILKHSYDSFNYIIYPCKFYCLNSQ